MKTKLLLLIDALLSASALAQTIDMSGAVSYQMLNSSVVNLKVQRIDNRGALFLNSGTLQLQGWATRSAYKGGTIVGYKLAQVTLGQLKGGYFWSNISENTNFTLPPISQKGVFHIVMVLAEYTPAGFVTRDYVNMGTEVMNVLSPQINSNSIISGTKGKYISANVTVIADSDFPVQLSASGLPPGLTLNKSTGVISGTPSSSGSFTCTITAINIAGVDQDIIKFDIKKGAATPDITNSTRYEIKNNEPFNVKIEATNNPYAFEAINIPAGLNLNPITGLINGIPTQAGQSQVTFIAYNSIGKGQKTVIFNIIKNKPYIISAPSISSTTEDNLKYQIIGTDNPIKFNAEFLPQGLYINKDSGIISGKPKKAGLFKVKLWAQNNIGNTSKDIQVVVLDEMLKKETSIKATTTSFALEPTKFTDKNGGVNWYFFTTYDGNKNQPPLFDYLGDGTENNSSISISQEARLVRNTIFEYETDYILYNSQGDLNYGEIKINIPSADFDLDGLPDFLDINKSVNLSTSGKIYNDDPFVIDSFVGNLKRDSGNNRGTYNISTVNGDVTGNWRLNSFTGELNYQIMPDINILTISASADLGNSNIKSSAYANSNFEIINQDQIRLPNIVFHAVTTGSNATATTGTAILNRLGNRYIGELKLDDGESDTEWPDYTDFILVIKDNNDSDGDGIPDITDLIESNLSIKSPEFSMHPNSRTVKIYDRNITLNAFASSKDPIAYQWYKNGEKIIGQSKSTLILQGHYSELIGDYYVEAKNSKGIVNSNIANISVSYDEASADPKFTLNIKRKNNAYIIDIINNTGLGLVLEQTKNLKDWKEISDITEQVNHSHPITTNEIQNYAFFRLREKLKTHVPLMITHNPVDVTVAVNNYAEFEVVASGPSPLTYQWYKDNIAIDGETHSKLKIEQSQLEDAAIYTVFIKHNNQSLISKPASLIVESNEVKNPIVIIHPKNTTIYRGQTAKFSVVVEGAEPLTYQWYRNGKIIKNADKSTYSTNLAGKYKVRISNEFGSVFSNEVTLTVRR